jgi:hypothetical protein
MPIAKGKSPTLIFFGLIVFALGVFIWSRGEAQSGIENYVKSVRLSKIGTALMVVGGLAAFVGMFVKGNFRKGK